jgi:hypothetical protein
LQKAVKAMTSTGAAEEILGEWTAVNRASGAAGSIHDDATARKLGFRGGFVPGATLVGYVCEGWRRREGLSLALRPFVITSDLRAPVYEREVARVRATAEGGRWSWRIETDSSGVTTEGTIDGSLNAMPSDTPTSAEPHFDGIDLDKIEPQQRSFSRAETVAFYEEMLGTTAPGDGELPVSPGMWCNPMSPVLARLNATHTSAHRSSELLVERLPLADVTYTFAISVAGTTPRGPGKGLVHVRCEVLDGDGRRLALIQHRSALRRRD